MAPGNIFVTVVSVLIAFCLILLSLLACLTIIFAYDGGDEKCVCVFFQDLHKGHFILQNTNGFIKVQECRAQSCKFPFG